MMKYEGAGATLLIDGRVVGTVSSGTVRLATDREGNPKWLIGINSKQEEVMISFGTRLN